MWGFRCWNKEVPHKGDDVVPLPASQNSALMSFWHRMAAVTTGWQAQSNPLSGPLRVGTAYYLRNTERYLQSKQLLDFSFKWISKLFKIQREMYTVCVVSLPCSANFFIEARDPSKSAVRRNSMWKLDTKSLPLWGEQTPYSTFSNWCGTLKPTGPVPCTQ